MEPRDLGFCCFLFYFSLNEGSLLQRLFSSFANGSPGWGLLLLRLVTGCVFIVKEISVLGAATAWQSSIGYLVAAAAGSLLLVGLWTPIVGSLVAISELWLYSSQGDGQEHLVLAANGVGLALIGPGAWSLDARLFGRKRVDVNRF